MPFMNKHNAFPLPVFFIINLFNNIQSRVTAKIFLLLKRQFDNRPFVHQKGPPPPRIYI